MAEQRNNPLEQEGWTRRCLATEPRLSEMTELYKSLHFEVRLEPITESDLKEAPCSVCYEEAREQFKIIYTRPGAKLDNDNDE